MNEAMNETTNQPDCTSNTTNGQQQRNTQISYGRLMQAQSITFSFKRKMPMKTSAKNFRIT